MQQRYPPHPSPPPKPPPAWLLTVLFVLPPTNRIPGRNWVGHERDMKGASGIVLSRVGGNGRLELYGWRIEHHWGW